MRALQGIMQKYMPGMITCQQVDQFLMDYLDGTLPRVQRIRFERHLRFCRDCRDYIRAYQASIRLGRQALADPPIPAEPPADLVTAILDASGRDPRT